MLSSAKSKILSYEGDDFLQEVIEVIKRHISEEDFKVKTIAKLMFVSRSCLFYRLKRYDLKPKSIIDVIKIDISIDMLKNQPHLSLFEISDYLGFKTPDLFYHYFKKFNGMTPKEFRTKCQEEKCQRENLDEKDSERVQEEIE